MRKWGRVEERRGEAAPPPKFALGILREVWEGVRGGLALCYNFSMKLIIQIPCYNEAAVLPHTIQQLPRSLPGVDELEFLVVDDGSQDGTAEVAAAGGRASRGGACRGTWGWPRPSAPGWKQALKQGADIIVNTDADNQYHAEDIQPSDRADPGRSGADRGRRPRCGDAAGLLADQAAACSGWAAGSSRSASGMEIPDATSGFRALSREAALRTLVLSEYSYTLETLIQAGARQPAGGLRAGAHQPADAPSRLMRSIPHYLANSTTTIVRAYTLYRPLRVFFDAGGDPAGGGG